MKNGCWIRRWCFTPVRNTSVCLSVLKWAVALEMVGWCGNNKERGSHFQRHHRYRAYLCQMNTAACCESCFITLACPIASIFLGWMQKASDRSRGTHHWSGQLMNIMQQFWHRFWPSEEYRLWYMNDPEAASPYDDARIFSLACQWTGSHTHLPLCYCWRIEYYTMN